MNNRTSVKRKLKEVFTILNILINQLKSKFLIYNFVKKKRIKSPLPTAASTLLTNREIKEKPSFILATYIQATDRGESRNNTRQAAAGSSPPVSSRQPRPQSPIYFPSMASVLKETTKRQANVVATTRPRSSMKPKNSLTDTTSTTGGIRPGN